MKVFRKVYELNYEYDMFFVYRSIEFFGLKISKKLLKEFITIEAAVKYLKTLK
jgi:hypothetical protein